MTPTTSELEFATATLLSALSLRSLETGNHCPRVCRLSLAIGRALGLSGAALQELKFGSLLHDVGKIGVPDTVLCKPDRLTAAEWELMRRHPILGANMLHGLNFPEAICLIVEQHHERIDGQGYPFRLTREEISAEAKIFAVADAYDALTRDRVYRRGVDHHSALAEISSWSGSQFDEAAVAALAQLPELPH